MGHKRLARQADDTEVFTPSLPDFAARLAQHGEAFMKMFDRPEESAGRAPKRAKIAEALPTTKPSRKSHVAESPKHTPAVRSHGPKDALADIWSDGKDRKKRPHTYISSAQSTPSQPAPVDASAMKAERRRFMSGKASDVHRAATPQQQQQQQQPSGLADGLTGPSREDFLTMQREVQMFGADALDKKQRKQFDAWQLQNVKAVPQKPGRVSAAIGKGIAKKQAERQQKAKEEAIASGMLTVKGSGKQKRRSDGDRGLAEDGGLFKGGMLRIKGALGKEMEKKRKKGSNSHKRAFSSSRIGNLDGNSQKAWNVAKTQNKKMKGPARKKR